MAYNDIYRLVVHCRLHGQEIINKLHFVQDGVNPGNQSQVLADDFRTNMDTTIRARCHPDMKFEFVEVQCIVPFGDGPAVSNWPANTAGTGSAAFAAAPGMVAEVITIYTGQAGRRKRGRLYLAGMTSGNVVSGSLSAAQTTATTALATALMTRYGQPAGVNSWRMGVWSRLIAGPAPPWTTDAFAPVSGLAVRTIARTQRRRQIGVGR
jgi:hypothetical protein